MPPECLAEISASELREKRVLRIRAGSREILLADTAQGFAAYSAVCPHLAGPLLDGTVRDGCIVCPWHQYAYDLESGACRTVPGRPWRRCEGVTAAQQPMPLRLRRLPLEVEGDRLRILSGRGR